MSGRFLRSVIALFIVILVSNAQDFPDDVTFFGLGYKIKQAKRSALTIETMKKTDDYKKVNPVLLGSGFLALKSKKIYAVTNFHVVKKIPKDFHSLIGVNLKNGKVHFIANLVRADEANDIAILEITDEFYTRFPVDPDSVHPNQAAIGVSMFADSADFTEGEGVILVGFPLGLGSEILGNQPVSRIGIIAQALSQSGTFLVDGTASRGNSGSAVLDLKTGKLLGMIRGFPNDYIEAFDEQNQIVARLPYNSGLTICISSFAILRLLP